MTTMRLPASWLTRRRVRGSSRRPRVPSTSIRSPVRIREVPTEQPTTQGMPYSRLTMAAWVSEPPPSQTHPPMRAKAGVQFGEVASHTRISPSSSVVQLGGRHHHPRPARDRARRGREPGEHRGVGVGLQALEVVVVHAEDLDEDRVLDLVGQRADASSARSSRISL